MKSVSSISLAAAFSCLLLSPAEGASPSQYLKLSIQDKPGCSVMHWSVPESNEQVKWTGQCKNGRAHGTGILDFTYADKKFGRKHSFVGELENGEYLKGETYSGPVITSEGNFKNGRLHGTGTKFYRDGSYTAGNFVEGTPHGKGVFVSKGGPHYEGNFIRGKLQGPGKVTYFGTNYAKVVFKDHNVVSWGKLVTPKYIIDAPHKKGIANGKGSITYKDGKIYKGGIKANLPHGEGSITFPSGSVFVSNFKDGKPYGKSTLFYSNGTRYDGELNLANMKPNGQGIYVYKNGTRVSGTFKDGKHHGFIEFAYGNGTIFRGRYKDGKINGTSHYVNTKKRQCSGMFDDNQRLLKPGDVYYNDKKVGRCYMKEGILTFDYR